MIAMARSAAALAQQLRVLGPAAMWVTGKRQRSEERAGLVPAIGAGGVPPVTGQEHGAPWKLDGKSRGAVVMQGPDGCGGVHADDDQAGLSPGEFPLTETTSWVRGPADHVGHRASQPCRGRRTSAF